MPELPEVEVIRRFLSEEMVNEVIDFLEVIYDKAIDCYDNYCVDRLSGQKVKFVNRRGKYIHIGLTKNNLIVHLRMTGQLYYGKNIKRMDHLRWILHFKSGQKLYFRDVRKFGRLDILPQDKIRFLKNAKIGPEPWDMDQDLWLKSLKTKRLIKTVLLDQSVIAGIGNIYADEALHLSRLHPGQRSCDLSPNEAIRLLESVRIVLEKGIRYKGTTFKDYRNADGKSGLMQNHLKVYQRTGKGCMTCNAIIMREKIGGRSSHFCPNCQRIGKV